MVRYAVRDLYALLQWTEHTIRVTRSQEEKRLGSDSVLNSTERININNQVGCLLKHCRQLELTETVTACEGLLRVLNVVPFKETSCACTLGECRGHLVAIRRMIIKALQNRLFMYIPVGLSVYVNKSQSPTVLTSQLTMFGIDERSNDTIYTTADWFDPDSPVKPFGDKVFDAFPKARYDAEHAALCIATGAATASVFHLMRTVEHGVRSLGKSLGLSRIKESVNAKSKPGAASPVCPTCGKVVSLGKKVTKFTPIENCVWEKIENQIRSKVDARLRLLRPGPARDNKQAFFSQIILDFHGFREAWRNHVMHTRAEFLEPDAMRVLSHVDRFMRLLAEQTS